MSLNKSVRFLVLNRTNQAVRAKDENIPGMDAATLKGAGEISKKVSPSFKNKATAQKFGAALASKYPGERFYLAQIIAGCVVEPSTGPWVATGGVADEHMADIDSDVDADDLDDSDNE